MLWAGPFQRLQNCLNLWSILRGVDIVSTKRLSCFHYSVNKAVPNMIHDHVLEAKPSFPITNRNTDPDRPDEMAFNSVWSQRLVFPESQIADIVYALNNCLSTSKNVVEARFSISICCVPPEFKPAVVIIPVYRGSQAEGRIQFEPLFRLQPVATFPTYLHHVPIPLLAI
jgi:hypothetical protein